MSLDRLPLDIWKLIFHFFPKAANERRNRFWAKLNNLFFCFLTRIRNLAVTISSCFLISKKVNIVLSSHRSSLLKLSYHYLCGYDQNEKKIKF